MKQLIIAPGSELKRSIAIEQITTTESYWKNLNVSQRQKGWLVMSRDLEKQGDRISDGAVILKAKPEALKTWQCALPIWLASDRNV